MALGSAVGADIGEAAERNGHDDDVTPPPGPSPIADKAQRHENGALVTVSSAGDPAGDAADGERSPFQREGEANPPRDYVQPVQGEEKPSTQAPTTAPSRPSRAKNRKDAPARTQTHRSKRAVANGQGASAPVRMAPGHTPPDDAQSQGEGTVGHPAPPHDGEAVKPAAGLVRHIDVSARTDDGDSVPGDRTRCGYCGETQFVSVSEETGKIFCKCESVYRPSTGRWHSRKDPQRQRPLAPLSTTAACRRPNISIQPSATTASSIAGRHTAMDGQ
jgi:hypothetical protein